MSTVQAKKAKPLFRATLRKAPGHPLGDRVLVRRLEPQDESIIVTPDVAKEWLAAGILLAAGDQAAEKLYDLGVEIGDEIWFGKYAGVIQEWRHITKDGDPECAHEGVWDFVATLGKDHTLRKCRACGAEREEEPALLMNVMDLQLSVDLGERVESGKVKRVRMQDAEGRTRFVLEGVTDTFSAGE